MEGTKPQLIFENLWQKSATPTHQKVEQIWRKHFPALSEEQISKRLQQVIFTVQTEGEVVAVSTSFRAYIPQLRNHLYAFRFFIDPAYRFPGLMEVILVKTRDFMEEISQTDGPDDTRCIGLITLVENERMRKYRTEAIFPASKMVYVGNSPKGYQIRVYYFKKALI